MWPDFRAPGLADDALEAFFVEGVGLRLNAGIARLEAALIRWGF
jgi:hypothetical protein